MKNPFDELLCYFAESLLLDENFFDFCALARINFKDWPECFARKVALEYSEMRLSRGHGFAAVQLSGHLDNLQNSGDFYRDKAKLKAYYETTLKEFKVKTLSRILYADPLNFEKHMANFEIQKPSAKMGYIPAKIEGAYRESLRLFDSDEALRTLPDWPILSHLVGGFNPGRVGMLLAQTGFGKTTAAINLALAASRKFNATYFNMEMIDQDFLEKIMLSVLKESFYTLKNAPRSLEGKLAKALPRFYQSKLHYSDGSTLSPNEIFSICRSLKKEHGLDFVVVDYDQKLLVDVTRDTPEWKALQIAVEQFEVLAKELNCFVLILAQESGDGEVSGSKRSKFPVSTVMRFYKNDDGKFLIQAVKNRFGKRNATIEVNYDAEKSYVSEVRECSDIENRPEQTLLARPKR